MLHRIITQSVITAVAAADVAAATAAPAIAAAAAAGDDIRKGCGTLNKRLEENCCSKDLLPVASWMGKMAVSENFSKLPRL